MAKTSASLALAVQGNETLPSSFKKMKGVFLSLCTQTLFHMYRSTESIHNKNTDKYIHVYKDNLKASAKRST